jgi:hypothetical protein
MSSGQQDNTEPAASNDAAIPQSTDLPPAAPTNTIDGNNSLLETGSSINIGDLEPDNMDFEVTAREQENNRE